MEAVVKEVQILKAITAYVEKHQRPITQHMLDALGIPKSKVKKLVRRGHLNEIYLTTSRGYILSYAPVTWNPPEGVLNPLYRGGVK